MKKAFERMRSVFVSIVARISARDVLGVLAGSVTACGLAQIFGWAWAAVTIAGPIFTLCVVAEWRDGQDRSAAIKGRRN